MVRRVAIVVIELDDDGTPDEAALYAAIKRLRRADVTFGVDVAPARTLASEPCADCPDNRAEPSIVESAQIPVEVVADEPQRAVWEGPPSSNEASVPTRHGSGRGRRREG